MRRGYPPVTIDAPSRGSSVAMQVDTVERGSIPNLRRAVAVGDGSAARMARRLHSAVQRVHVPVPRMAALPLLWVFIALRSTYYLAYRLFICEPLFRAYCRRCGRNLRTG